MRVGLGLVCFTDTLDILNILEKSTSVFIFSALLDTISFMIQHENILVDINYAVVSLQPPPVKERTLDFHTEISLAMMQLSPLTGARAVL